MATGSTIVSVILHIGGERYVIWPEEQITVTAAGDEDGRISNATPADRRASSAEVLNALGGAALTVTLFAAIFSPTLVTGPM